MRVYFNKDGMDEWLNTMRPTWRGYINTAKEWVGLIEELRINSFTGELEEHDATCHKYKFDDRTFIERDMSLLRVLAAPFNFVAITGWYILALAISVILLPFAALYNIKFDFRSRS